MGGEFSPTCAATARPAPARACPCVDWARIRLAYAWEHALVGTRRAPCLRQYVAHFDIFLYVHRVPRIVWYHVDWVVLPRGPDDRKIARCVSVVGKRRGCIDSF